MGTLTRYREIVQQLFEEYGRFRPSHGQIDSEVIVDPTRDQFELMHIGWDGERRVHGTVLHVDLRDDKIWIQYDGTDRPLAEALVRAGVSREAIVLAVHPAALRQHTGYGVG